MSDTIVCDFVFVPNGASFPTDWVRRHPDYITLPARFTGSPAFMERMFGKRRTPDRYVFDKTVRMPAQLGLTETGRTETPAAQVQQRIGFVATAEPIQKTDSGSAPIAVPEHGASDNDKTSARDIWTGLTKDELLGPGLAYLERRAGDDGIIDFIAGLDFGLGDGQFRAADAKLQSGVADPVRIAATGDLKCDGFSGGCSSGGSRGTTGMYNVTGQVLCVSCAIKMIGVANEKAAEQIRALQPFTLPGR